MQALNDGLSAGLNDGVNGVAQSGASAVVAAAAPATSPATLRATTDVQLVQRTLQAFLSALDRGDDALEPWFTPEATMYFPFRNSQALLHGRAAIVARFARMNAQLRLTRAAPPYIGFGMHHLEVEWLAPGWALATAIFTFADQWGRRTLLLRGDPDPNGEVSGWRIHHLHASNLQAPAVEAAGETTAG